jgi:phage baseplate assembly protein W
MKNDNVYKGISFPFRFNSQGRVERSQLTPSDFSRIRESIAQILLTFKNERIMNGEFGSIRGAIFDPIEDITDVAILQSEVQTAIEENEDRVIVNDVRVYTEPGDTGKIVVDIDVHIIKFMKDAELTVPLELS